MFIVTKTGQTKQHEGNLKWPPSEITAGGRFRINFSSSDPVAAQSLREHGFISQNESLSRGAVRFQFFKTRANPSGCFPTTQQVFFGGIFQWRGEVLRLQRLGGNPFLVLTT